METQYKPNDLHTAFRYKSSKELKLSKMVFSIIKFPACVKMLSFFTLLSLKLHLPVKSLIRKTVFKVFCSGETLNQALILVNKLGRYRVLGVLDYVSEGEKNREAYDYNKNMITNNIHKLKEMIVGYAISLKLSGLEDVEFIKHVQENSESLTKEELLRYDEFTNRVEEICKLAASKGIVVFIDAEEYATQNIFDRVTELMIRRHNKEKAIVFNTLQMYLKDRNEYLLKLIDEAKEGQYRLGIKLVRGAYVEKERELAKEMGIPSPVFDTKEETDLSFNHAVETCLKHTNYLDACFATHNEESVKIALELIDFYGVDIKHVSFSQLYGMSDHLTFNLADAGFDASKYLPYGEIEKAIPYLIRRAEENSAIGGQMGRELELLKKELERRNQLSVSYN